MFSAVFWLLSKSDDHADGTSATTYVPVNCDPATGGTAGTIIVSEAWSSKLKFDVWGTTTGTARWSLEYSILNAEAAWFPGDQLEEPCAISETFPPEQVWEKAL